MDNVNAVCMMFARRVAYGMRFRRVAEADMYAMGIASVLPAFGWRMSGWKADMESPDIVVEVEPECAVDGAATKMVLRFNWAGLSA